MGHCFWGTYERRHSKPSRHRALRHEHCQAGSPSHCGDLVTILASSHFGRKGSVGASARVWPWRLPVYGMGDNQNERGI